MPISTDDVGHRVVLRRRVGHDRFTDVLGRLDSYDENNAVVRRDDGTDITVPLGDIAAAKRIPPKPARRIADLDLERIAALGWPGIEQAHIGGWLLRAGGGFTGRANSVLPLGDPGVEDAVERVCAWYAERGLPPMLQVPLPSRGALADALREEGWEDTHGGIVMTTATANLLTHPRPDLPPIEIDPVPTDEWLSLYHYRGGRIPDVGKAVLMAGPEPRFVSLRVDGTTAAICRVAVAEGWVGVTAMEVAPAYRRQGLARHVLRETAARVDARYAYLQVAPDNASGLALYESVGFTTHHTYTYLRAGLRTGLRTAEA